jgi:hypothetical protein
MSIFLLHAAATLYSTDGVGPGPRATPFPALTYWLPGVLAGLWLGLAAACAWGGRPRRLIPPSLRDWVDSSDT